LDRGYWAYGAELCKYLQKKGIDVYEVNIPDRACRRLRRKSEPTDAKSMAQSVLIEETSAIPKSHYGVVEASQFIVVARETSVK
jgi:transposase